MNARALGVSNVSSAGGVCIRSWGESFRDTSYSGRPLRRPASGTAAFVAVLLPIAIALVSADAVAQSYLFNEAGFTTGSSPQALTSADFNGDGQPDLAVVDHGAAAVSILLGKSNGTFAAKVDYSVGNDPDAVVAADFNNDGKMDLAIVSSSGNSVSILIGAGDGTFTSSGTLATGNGPNSIVAGDLNGDGNSDLVVSNFNDSTVSVFLGKGDGTFGAGTNFSTGSSTSPDSVAVGDFNGDGNLDVATADSAANDVSILLGNGDGTLRSPSQYKCGLKPLQVIVNDFNRDGRLDLAVTDGGEFYVVVLLGKGDGSFPSQETVATQNVPLSLVSGDFNGDGYPDIAYTSTAGNFVAILIGASNGGGTFTSGPMYATGISGGSPGALLTTDFNGDGRLDLAIVNPADNNVAIMLGNGDANCTFASSTPSTAVGTAPLAVATGDFNQDGTLDAVVVSAATNSVAVLIGTGSGGFQTPVNYTVGTSPQSVAVADLNGDNYPDLAVVNDGSNTVSVLPNNGDGTFATPVSYTVGNFPLAIAIGDFNGDGLQDLAVVNARDDTVSILLNTGNGAFGAPATYGAGFYPTAVAAANLFNHANGILDLAICDEEGNAVSILQGNGNGTFKKGVTYSVATTSVTNPAPVALAAGDFNGDGYPDLATADYASSTVSILLNNVSNPGTFGTATTFPTGTTPVSIAAGDLNGDGHLDLAVGNTSGNIDSVSTLLGNGDGTFQTHLEHATGFSPATGAVAEGVALGDFTGTGGTLSVIASDYTYNVVDVFLNTPVIAISPVSINFPDTQVGTTSSPIPVAISNPGSAALPFSGTTISYGTFAVSNDCPSSIAVGGTCTASVTFTPTTTGPATGGLTITDGAFTNPQTVSLTGTGTGGGPVVTLSPASLTFKTQLIRTTSPAQNVTLTNTGNATLSINSIRITGINSTDFSQTNTCGTSVAAGASCAISVTFKPIAKGTRTASVSITDNAAGSPQTVPLTGTGTVVKLSGTSLNFGSQKVGTTSLPLPVIMTNESSTTLSISKIGITGRNAGDFAETNNCGTSLGAGKSCTINVTFTPHATGARRGSLSISDNGGGSPQVVSLTGTGT